jgi:hypothetical protein
MITVHGPGRCTECSFHVATQGHREGCDGTAPVTPASEYRRDDLPREMWEIAEWLGVLPKQERPKRRRPQGGPVARVGANRAYVAKGLRTELQSLYSLKDGERNDGLTPVACRVFEFVKAGHVDKDAAWAELERIALEIGLEPSEIKSTLKHQWEKVGPAHIPAPGTQQVTEVTAEDLK